MSPWHPSLIMLPNLCCCDNKSLSFDCSRSKQCAPVRFTGGYSERRGISDDLGAHTPKREWRFGKTEVEADQEPNMAEWSEKWREDFAACFYWTGEKVCQRWILFPFQNEARWSWLISLKGVSLTYSLSFSIGPLSISTSKRCSFWYLCSRLPSLSIHSNVFLIFFLSSPSFTAAGFDDGSWTPTLMASLCLRASAQSPWTNGDDKAGWQRDMDSLALEAM